ncbi:MAG: LacI family DNA-binding transcriptional regulator [Ignavibacteriaceae bacterium]
MVTLLDIAHKSGVSVSTVSRVLNNKAPKYRISQSTVELVMHAAKELNYHPNELARGLRLNKTHTIGLVVPDISNPFFAYITHVIQTQAYQFGYSLIVCSTNENITTEIEQIELLRRKGIDGYIIMPIGTKYKHIEELLNLNKPVVLLDRCIDQLNTNSVIVDNYSGASDAVEHLISLGHTKIAIIQGLPNTYTNNARVNGYKDVLRKHDIPINENFIVGNDFRKENGYIETKILLNLETRPTAIFSTSDLITLGVLEAIFEEKLHIPDDISIVAFDDIDFAPFLVSPLTAVKQPRELMGEVAVKLLIENIASKNKSERKRITLKPELVVRKSVFNLNKQEAAAV